MESVCFNLFLFILNSMYADILPKKKKMYVDIYTYTKDSFQINKTLGLS